MPRLISPIAASIHAMLHDTAVTGTEHVLRACARAGVERIVVTSSSVVFGYSRDAREIDEVRRAWPTATTNRLTSRRRSRSIDVPGTWRAAGPGRAPRVPHHDARSNSARLGPSNGLVVAYLADRCACTFPGGCNLVSAARRGAGPRADRGAGSSGGSYLLGSQNMTWRRDPQRDRGTCWRGCRHDCDADAFPGVSCRHRR